jgi:hypothetical protein
MRSRAHTRYLSRSAHTLSHLDREGLLGQHIRRHAGAEIEAKKQREEEGDDGCGRIDCTEGREKLVEHHVRARDETEGECLCRQISVREWVSGCVGKWANVCVKRGRLRGGWGASGATEGHVDRGSH